MEDRRMIGQEEKYCGLQLKALKDEGWKNVSRLVIVRVHQKTLFKYRQGSPENDI